MGYTSVINQHTGKVQTKSQSSAPVDPDDQADMNSQTIHTSEGTMSSGLDNINIKPKKKLKKCTLGTLFQLSQACHATARGIAATGLFATVYDNINMMIRVAEQILGQKSELLHL
jgi:hypothetical protein